MAGTGKQLREQKRRIAQMEAKRALRTDQLARRKRDNFLIGIVAAVAVVLAVVLQLTAFASNPTEAEFAAAEAGLGGASASPSASASPTNGANIPKPETAAGKKFTGQLSLNGKAVGVELDGTTAPQATAVFASLTQQNFFKGLSCHRLTTGSASILQCGSKDGKGSADTSYEWGPVENTPADGKYPAGSIAVARGATTASNGTQFFIVYKDTVLDQSTGGYTIMGKVTSGLDVVTQIAAKGIKGGGTATDGAPAAAVTIDSFSLK
ncbi:peptidylprolyl isomerase [Pseudarthrobacter sp. J1738]|uniref:peptidylprolyl isomerase n=1 Tax=unclassified Pseudarthrobacter TaxID=2647000 RepID=UPI003D2983BF